MEVVERKGNWEEQTEYILGLGMPHEDELCNKTQIDARRQKEGHIPGWHGISNWAKQIHKREKIQKYWELAFKIGEQWHGFKVKTILAITGCPEEGIWH